MLAQQHHLTNLDAVLFDLGTSSYQLTTPQRGFTFQQDALLDMRMNQQENIPTAADIVNQWPEEALANAIYQLGEERHSRAIARQIVQARRHHRISTTGELAQLVMRVVPRTGRIHPATKTFQALRMAVNQELESIDRALPQVVPMLRSGGRLAVISFHSLEARLVKQFFQQEAKDCLCPSQQPTCTCRHKKSVKLITKKALKPTPDEIKHNPRARSAQLRVLEKL